MLGVHETAPARGREAELIEQEIRLAEQEIAAQEKMVKVGLAPTEKVTAARRELLQLQRQLVVAQGGAIPGTSPASAKEQALIQEEIKLAERELAQIQEKFKMGVATEDSLLGPRREVLKLQRQLLGHEELPPGSPQAPAATPRGPGARLGGGPPGRRGEGREPGGRRDPTTQEPHAEQPGPAERPGPRERE